MKLFVNGLYRIVNWASVISILVMVLLVFANVVMRYLFDSGLPWSEEAARIAFVWVVFLGIILANRDGTHLKVDILSSKFKGWSRIAAIIFEKVVTIVLLSAVIIGAWKLILLTQSQALPATGLPAYIFYVAGVVSFVVLLVTTVTNISKRNKDEEQ